MTQKLTKQGVRDLDHIKAPPGGRRLEAPPMVIDCKHKDVREIEEWYFVVRVCNTCGKHLGDVTW